MNLSYSYLNLNNYACFDNNNNNKYNNIEREGWKRGNVLFRLTLCSTRPSRFRVIKFPHII